MLNPDFKAKWIAALESGEYKQTEGILHNTRNGGYCCLGVACVVAGAIFKIDANEEGGIVAIRGGAVISHESIVLSTLLMEEIGLSASEQERLYQMNDGHLPNNHHHYSFQEIANYIKENL